MGRINLSHPRAITPISDPIHGRMEFNLFEREFIDSKFFQKLHFILQNSTAYIAFPANKNTRFPHSLGTAHVAGIMFSKGLQNAGFTALDKFFEEANFFLVHLMSRLRIGAFRSLAAYKEAHPASISGLARFLHTPIFPEMSNPRVDTNRKYGVEGFTAAFIADTYWQAIRLYGLMHDIGHLPMSHAFEDGLKHRNDLLEAYERDKSYTVELERIYTSRIQEFSGLSEEQDKNDYIEIFSKILKCTPESINEVAFNKAFHEVRGLSIFNRYVRDYSSGFGSSIEQYARLIQYLTLSIFFSPAIGIDREKKHQEFAVFFSPDFKGISGR